jgi:hypothetical protein
MQIAEIPSSLHAVSVPIFPETRFLELPHGSGLTGVDAEAVAGEGGSNLMMWKGASDANRAQPNCGR